MARGNWKATKDTNQTKTVGGLSWRNDQPPGGRPFFIPNFDPNIRPRIADQRQDSLRIGRCFAIERKNNIARLER